MKLFNLFEGTKESMRMTDNVGYIELEKPRPGVIRMLLKSGPNTDQIQDVIESNGDIWGMIETLRERFGFQEIKVLDQQGQPMESETLSVGELAEIALDHVEDPIDESFDEPNTGATVEEIADAIMFRLRPRIGELAGMHGPEAIMAAVEDVAQFHEGADELGSSDISGMVSDVLERLTPTMEAVFESLSSLLEGVPTQEELSDKMLYLKQLLLQHGSGDSEVVQDIQKNMARINQVAQKLGYTLATKASYDPNQQGDVPVHDLSMGESLNEDEGAQAATVERLEKAGGKLVSLTYKDQQGQTALVGKNGIRYFVIFPDGKFDTKIDTNKLASEGWTKVEEPKDEKRSVNLKSLASRIEQAVQVTFPDADPFDELRKNGTLAAITNIGAEPMEEMDKAAKKFLGASDYHNFLSQFWEQHADDNPNAAEGDPWS